MELNDSTANKHTVQLTCCTNILRGTTQKTLNNKTGSN